MMQGSLPHKLRVLRTRRGLTLIEAAALTGVTRATLSDLERGHRHPVAPTLAKIAEGYGVPIEELLIEEEPALAGKAEASETGQAVSKAPRLPEYILEMPPPEIKAYGEELSIEELEELCRVFGAHGAFWNDVLGTEKEAGRERSELALQAYHEIDRNGRPAMILGCLLDIKRGRAAQKKLEEVLVG